MMPYLASDLRPTRRPAGSCRRGLCAQLPQPFSGLCAMHMSTPARGCLGLRVQTDVNVRCRPAALDPVAGHIPCLHVVLAPNPTKRTDRMFWYLSHIANGIFQIEFVENIQNPIS